MYMMKKYFIFLASAVLLSAASCHKEEINTVVDVPVETEIITVELNPMTKTSLSDDMNTIWSENDKVGVLVNGTTIGVLTLVEGNTFSGKVEVGHQGEATLRYPAGADNVPATQIAVPNTFANGAALLEGATTLEALRAGQGVELVNKTALLSFSVSVTGNVAFTIGSTTYTMTGCEAGKIYYVCVDPANSGKLSYTVGLALGSKSKAAFQPVAGKIYDLGELTLKESIYGVIGVNGDWNTDLPVYETAQNNFFVSYGVKFNSDSQFKIRKKGEWPEDYNFGSVGDKVREKNTAVGVYTHGDSGQIKVKAGTYDIYFDRIAGQVYIMEPGKSYTEATKQSKPNYTYGLVGTFTGWDSNLDMNYAGDGIWTLTRSFTNSEEWKVRKGNDWNTACNNVWAGWALKSVVGGDNNLKMNNAGEYIISFIEKDAKDSNSHITIMKK